MRFNRFSHLIAFSGKAHRRSPASGRVITKMPDTNAPSQAKRTPDFGPYIPLSGTRYGVAPETDHVVHGVAGVVGHLLHETEQTGPPEAPVRQQQGPDVGGQVSQQPADEELFHSVLGRVQLCRRGHPPRIKYGVTLLSRGKPRPRKQTAANSPLRPWPRSDQSIMMGTSPVTGPPDRSVPTMPSASPRCRKQRWTKSEIAASYAGDGNRATEYATTAPTPR